MNNTTEIHDRATRPIFQINHYAENLVGHGMAAAEVDKLYQDDAVWIITSSFIIFTMHSGFGLLESGSVSAKDEVNIMVKNVVDVVFGGIAYWSVGYGLSYGDEWYPNPVIGLGKFFYDPARLDLAVNEEGWAYASFLFQMSLATTASTIVSGAVAERAKLKSYILLGCLVILVQALPAHWIWDPHGFFFQMGVVDFAGCSAVHMVGGIIGLVATIYLKPRRNRFNEDSVHQMSSPTNALLGTFLLWWGWFGINAGSVWGITDGRWRLGGRAAVATIMASIGGGATAIVISFIRTKKLQVNLLINGILSSIVSITALCAVSRPWHALIIGSVSSGFSYAVLPLLERFKIDDPVGIVPIHLTSSIWGMFAVGIFAEKDRYLNATSGQNGLLYGGGFRLLGIQMLATVTIVVYSALAGLLVLVGISKSPLGLRVTDYEEQIGADVIEHGLAGTNIARYVIEKPLSTKTFQTVTKAITKWKILAKTRSREKRMENARIRREQQTTTLVEEAPQTLNHRANGVLTNGHVGQNDRRSGSESVAISMTERRLNHRLPSLNNHRPSGPFSARGGNGVPPNGGPRHSSLSGQRTRSPRDEASNDLQMENLSASDARAESVAVEEFPTTSPSPLPGSSTTSSVTGLVPSSSSLPAAHPSIRQPRLSSSPAPTPISLDPSGARPRSNQVAPHSRVPRGANDESAA